MVENFKKVAEKHGVKKFNTKKALQAYKVVEVEATKEAIVNSVVFVVWYLHTKYGWNQKRLVRYITYAHNYLQPVSYTHLDVYKRQGLGWQVETLESKLKGCTNVVLYYGSSSYDTKQMSMLIDNIVQDCKALGIETMTPRELQALKDGWKQ